MVWHPSFYAPEEGEFDLCVHQGNTARLKCTAKVLLQVANVLILCRLTKTQGHHSILYEKDHEMTIDFIKKSIVTLVHCNCIKITYSML